MHVDDDLKSHHAEIGAHVLGQTGLQELVELLIDVLQLLLDGGFGEHILLAEHLGCLLREEILTAFHHFSHLPEDLPVHLLRRDMAPEARVIHHIAGLLADQSLLGWVAKLVLNETCEKRLSRHYLSCFPSTAASRIPAAMPRR